jgi:NDP-sugar pyrophosphorylase family protein
MIIDKCQLITEKIDVVVLCGGLGKRLRGILFDRPKPMAEINRRPFLDILIEYVAEYGFKRFILCIGYMGEVIRKHYQKKSIPLTILFSEEKEPLGTGGAVKNASHLIRSDPFFVMNGDSICRVDLSKFFSFHREKDAICTLVLTRVDEVCDYGRVDVGEDGKIKGFNEKIKAKERSLVNAGIYLMKRKLLSLIPDGKYSLEYDLFPMLCDGRLYGFITEAQLLDIGTPKRYLEAKELLKYEKGYRPSIS